MSLERLTAKKRQLEKDWKTAIRAELAAGKSLREVATTAGISHEQVRRITKEAR